MQLLTLEQNTPEWHAFRAGKKMASESSSIIGVSDYSTALDVFNKKVLGEEQEFSEFLQRAMQRGHDLEPAARAKCEAETGIVFEPYVIEGDDDFAASVDGADLSLTRDDVINSIAEIKCPVKGLTSARGEMALKGELSETDLIQVNHQLLVTNAPVCHFFVYQDDSRFARVEVTPDKEIQKRIVEAWEEFWPHVISKTAPEPGPRDYVELETNEWKFAVSDYLNAVENAARMKKALDDAKAKVLELSGERNTIGAGLRVTRFYRQGAVDYKKVPQLTDVDLEGFRKKGTYQNKISEVKS